MPLQVTLRSAELHCPDCGVTTWVDERSPRHVIDWELSRFCCPRCWSMTSFAIVAAQVKDAGGRRRRRRQK